MKLGVFYDPGCRDGTRGGAELAMDEFLAECPKEVSLVGLDESDTVVIGNCVTAGPEMIEQLEGKRVIRFHHDLAHDENVELRGWLNQHADHVFTSPLHVEEYPGDWDDAVLIPPIGQLDKFRPNRETRRKGKRDGIVTVGSWQSVGKGGHLVSETAFSNGAEIDCYGTGPHRPYGSHVHDKGPVEHAELPGILARYEQFLFLPMVVEPFCRTVAEAWAAGCEILTNDNVGALWWIEEEPDLIYEGPELFWEFVCQK